MTDTDLLPKMNIDAKHTLAEVEEIYQRVTKNDYGHVAICKMQNTISILTTIKNIVEKYRVIDMDVTKNLKSFEYGAISQMLSGINLYINLFTPSKSEMQVLMNNADIKIQNELELNPGLQNIGYSRIIPHEDIEAIIEPLKNNCVKILECLVKQSDFMQVSHYFRNDCNEILPNLPLGAKRCLIPTPEGMKIKNVTEFNSREAFHVFSGFSMYSKLGTSVDDMYQIPISAVVNNLHIAAERADNGVAMPFVIKQDIACLITAFWHFIYSVISLLETIESDTLTMLVIPRITLQNFKQKYPQLTDTYKNYLATGVDDIPMENINLKATVVELMGSIFKSSFVQYIELCKQAASTENLFSTIKTAASENQMIQNSLAPLRNNSGLSKLFDSSFLSEDNIKNLMSGGFSMDTFSSLIDMINKK